MSAAAPDAPTPIWRPSPERVARAAMTRYLDWLRVHRGLDFADYESLWTWSVTDIEAFWDSIREHCGLRLATPAREVLREALSPLRRLRGARR